LREPGKHSRLEVRGVSSLVHVSTQQYAVILVRTVSHFERLVIAYPDEKTLRDLLAGPSIVALGYSSREEAEASICRRGNAARPLRRKSMATLVANGIQTVKEFVSSHSPEKNRLSLGKTQSTSRLLLSAVQRICFPQPSAL